MSFSVAVVNRRKAGIP